MKTQLYSDIFTNLQEAPWVDAKRNNVILVSSADWPCWYRRISLWKERGNGIGDLQTGWPALSMRKKIFLLASSLDDRCWLSKSSDPFPCSKQHYMFVCLSPGAGGGVGDEREHIHISGDSSPICKRHFVSMLKGIKSYLCLVQTGHFDIEAYI
jgi:hypothetical protein